MTGIDAYLDEVHRRLAGMDPGVRRDVIRELRSHLSESVVVNGGNEVAAMAGLGDPAAVARRYRELYGYGTSYRALFAAVSGVLGIFSVPVLVAGNEGIFPFFFSAVFLAVQFLFLIWVSVNAGNRAGLIAGVIGLAGRVGGLGAGVVASPGAATATPEGLGLFALVSVLLVLVGWIPGKAKQAWRRPTMDL